VKVSLFVTCLIDLFYPATGESVVEILEAQGIEVEFRSEQQCCGRFALEAGLTDDALTQARHFCDLFDDADLILVPSAACAAMIKVEYPRLLVDDPRAARLAGRTWELSQFLIDELRLPNLEVHYAGKIFHQVACHLQNDLNGTQAMSTLLAQVQEATLLPGRAYEECCGFGGPFSIQFPELSAAILETHVRRIEASGADVVVTCDPGCLLHLNGGLSRHGCRARAVHVADLLAGKVPAPPRPAPQKPKPPKPTRPRPW
jgi:L-lactate dehydrogenase complex protein LldE